MVPFSFSATREKLFPSAIDVLMEGNEVKEARVRVPKNYNKLKEKLRAEKGDA